MREAVELRSGLADLGGQELVVVDQLVGADTGPPVGLPGMRKLKARSPNLGIADS